MRKPFAIAIAFLLLCGMAQSQPPAPTPPKASQQPKNSATQEQRSASPQQAPASQPPAVLNQTTPTNPQLVIQQTNEEKNGEPATNWWLVVFTGGLVVVGLLQVWGLIRQNRIIASQSLIMSGQAETLKKQHEAIQRQADQMVEQWKLAKAALTSSQDTDRAWLSLDTLDLENFTEANRHSPQQPRGVLGVKNSGNTPATIHRAKVILWTTAPLPEVPPYDSVDWATAPNGAPPSHLVAHETTNWRYFFPNLITPDVFDAMTALGIGGRVWVFGMIEYADAFHPSKTRRYGFAREYDPWLTDKPEIGRRWAHVHNPNYSYAE